MPPFESGGPVLWKKKNVGVGNIDQNDAGQHRPMKFGKIDRKLIMNNIIRN